MLFLICLLMAIVIFIILYLCIKGVNTSSNVVQKRLRNMQGNEDEDVKISYRQVEMEKSFSDRVIKPIAERLLNTIKKFAPASMYESLEKDVEASGNFQGRGMLGFVVYMMLLTLGLLALVGLYIYTRPATHSLGVVRGMLMLLLALGLGIAFPIIVLKSMITERHDKIRQSLPDMLDLLCVSVQAGMGFDGAMGQVVAKMHGPLIEECDRFLQEFRMGVTRRNALLRLADRCGIKEMQLFVAALIQADKLGVGLAQVLEIQSENMRDFRRQRAREKASKLPTKILFPTLVFIFPVLFVVALVPPLISIFEFFTR